MLFGRMVLGDGIVPEKQEEAACGAEGGAEGGKEGGNVVQSGGAESGPSLALR